MLLNIQQLKNDFILNEEADKFQSMKDYLHDNISKSQNTENESGLLNTIYIISQFMKKKSIVFNVSRSIGLVLFNDRILINHSIFSSFINWKESVLYQIISSKIFCCQSLTKSQFFILANAKYVEGSIFDWRVLTYPDCDLTPKIIDNIIPIKGESFFMVSDHAQDMINFNTQPNFKIKKFSIIDMPPSQSGWPNTQDGKLEDIFLRYVDNEISPRKCWLLYKNEAS